MQHVQKGKIKARRGNLLLRRGVEIITQFLYLRESI
jgi:hypothetical protein